jgi:hypothetical protein
VVDMLRDGGSIFSWEQNPDVKYGFIIQA